MYAGPVRHDFGVLLLRHSVDARDDNPGPDLSRHAVPPVASRWFILADRSMVARHLYSVNEMTEGG